VFLIIQDQKSAPVVLRLACCQIPENRDKRERGVKENVKRKGGSMFVKSFKVVDAAESKRSSDHQALVTWDMLVLDFRCDYIDT
jgi:hypothetical protein